MDLCSKSVVKNLLEQADIRPSKKLGQNFLISRMILEKIIKTADLKKTFLVLEIGPGIGTLTQALAGKSNKIIAIEKDKRMIEILKKTLKDFDNVEIIEGDVLKITDYQLLITDYYKVVANLPYYITSPVIRKFLEAENPPLEMILMVQKEVAQRICASPPKMNLLAVAVQFYVHPHTSRGVEAGPQIISYVSKNCFWPKPKVDSAIIKITLKKELSDNSSRSDLEEKRSDLFLVSQPQHTIKPQLFFEIVRAGFSHPRKQLVNNLSNKLELKKSEITEWLLKNNIKPSQRAQTLSLENWLNLAKTFKNSIMKK